MASVLRSFPTKYVNKNLTPAVRGCVNSVGLPDRYLAVGWGLGPLVPLQEKKSLQINTTNVLK